MNKNKRAKLSTANTHLKTAIGIIEGVKSEEEFCLSNTPENLEGSERYEIMENAIDSLESAVDSIEEAIEYVDEAM